MRVGPNHTKFNSAQKESGIVVEFYQLIVVSVPDPCGAQTFIRFLILTCLISVPGQLVKWERCGFRELYAPAWVPGRIG